MPRLLASSAGFTYIAALVIVVIMGIMQGAIGQSMRIIMKREKEKELIFRGLQYRDAIERWSKEKAVPLKDLKDLVEPTVSSNIDRSKDRLLRKLYKDPITGGEWKTLPSPPDPIQGIYGVASTSNEEPLKQADFPEALKTFEGKKKYSEWEFIYKKRPGSAPAGGQPVQPSMPLSPPEGP